MEFFTSHLEEILWSILTGIVAWLYGKIKQYHKQIDATQSGIVALLRNSIIGLYNKYYELGYIPIYERENLEKMYKEYKALGGNCVIDHLVEELRSLNVNKKEDVKNGRNN